MRVLVLGNNVQLNTSVKTNNQKFNDALSRVYVQYTISPTLCLDTHLDDDKNCKFLDIRV